MSGNYQSRVFTFINKRTNRLKDNCAKGLRHLKVVVVWTGQILLYPIQLLAQATKIFPHQLESTPNQRSLPQPAPDIKIEQALDLVVEAGYPILFQRGSANEIAEQGGVATVDDWSIIDESIWNTGYGMTPTKSQDTIYHPRTSSQVRSKKPIIRGLSSLVSDRQLVLVTTENELLDLLTISQQQEIRRRIGIDIAIGWLQWRASQLAASQSTSQILAHEQPWLNNETDDRWLEIDGDNLAAQSLLAHGNIDLNKRELRSPTLGDRWHNWLQNFIPIQPKSSLNTLESVRELPATKYPFTPQPPRINRFVDLPQLPPIIEVETIPRQDNFVRSSIGKLSPNWLTTWFNYYRDYLYISSKTDSQITHQPSEFKLVPIEPEPQKVRYTTIAKQQNTSLNLQVPDLKVTASKISQQFARDLEYTPDWIEANAEPIGYSRSPLARFLAWLDRIFLAIENWLIKIWEIITNNPARS
jgi:hypothetical protein